MYARANVYLIRELENTVNYYRSCVNARTDEIINIRINLLIMHCADFALNYILLPIETISIK